MLLLDCVAMATMARCARVCYCLRKLENWCETRTGVHERDESPPVGVENQVRGLNSISYYTPLNASAVFPPPISSGVLGLGH